MYVCMYVHIYIYIKNVHNNNSMYVCVCACALCSNVSGRRAHYSISSNNKMAGWCLKPREPYIHHTACSKQCLRTPHPSGIVFEGGGAKPSHKLQIGWQGIICHFVWCPLSDPATKTGASSEDPRSTSICCAHIAWSIKNMCSAVGAWWRLFYTYTWSICYPEGIQWPARCDSRVQSRRCWSTTIMS